LAKRRRLKTSMSQSADNREEPILEVEEAAKLKVMLPTLEKIVSKKRQHESLLAKLRRWLRV
jgi:hypothetical protein